MSLSTSSSVDSLARPPSAPSVPPAPSPPIFSDAIPIEMGALLREWYRRGGRPEELNTPIHRTISPHEEDSDQAHSLFRLSVSSMGQNSSSGSVIIVRPDTADSLRTMSRDSSPLGGPSFPYGLGPAESEMPELRESISIARSDIVPPYQPDPQWCPGELGDSGHQVTVQGGLPLFQTTPVSLAGGEQLEFYLRFQRLPGVETLRHIAVMGYTVRHPEWFNEGLEQHVFTFNERQEEGFGPFIANSCVHLLSTVDYFQGKSLGRLVEWTHEQQLLHASIAQQERQTTSQDLRSAASGSRPGHHRSFSARAGGDHELSSLRVAAGSG